MYKGTANEIGDYTRDRAKKQLTGYLFNAVTSHRPLGGCTNGGDGTEKRERAPLDTFHRQVDPVGFTHRLRARRVPR